MFSAVNVTGTMRWGTTNLRWALLWVFLLLSSPPSSKSSNRNGYRPCSSPKFQCKRREGVQAHSTRLYVLLRPSLRAIKINTLSKHVLFQRFCLTEYMKSSKVESIQRLRCSLQAPAFAWVYQNIGRKINVVLQKSESYLIMGALAVAGHESMFLCALSSGPSNLGSKTRMFSSPNSASQLPSSLNSLCWLGHVFS
jgi:hypothetical protein